MIESVAGREQAEETSASDLTLRGTETPLPLDPANGIEVRGLCKKFRIATEEIGRVSGFLVHRLTTRQKRRTLWALRDVSFDVARGEILGIIGTNGAGKSTLLKTITGITSVNSGVVRRAPRIAALLDLSAGFHGSLTGFENLFLAASILGMSRDELREKLPAIIEFSGVDAKFLDSPVRFYSAGMLTRLGFALAVHTEPDIVLIDEVLAVGDAQFQAKSASRLLQFRDEGKSLILVSHVIGVIHQFCTRALWMHEGKVRATGPAAEISNSYRAFLNGRILAHGQEKAARQQFDSRLHPDAHQACDLSRGQSVRFDSLRLRDESGSTPKKFQTKGLLIIESQITAPEPVENAELIVSIFHETGAVVEEFFASERGLKIPRIVGRSRVSIRMEPLLLMRGRFFVELRFIDRANPNSVLGHSGEARFEVDMPFLDLLPNTYPAWLPCEFEMD